jgi:uncharacterized protein DUF5916/cellulose/xylan binding protein with CBM9 domain
MLVMPFAAVLLAFADPQTKSTAGSPPDPDPPTAVRAVRIKEPIEVDGRLDEPAWKTATVISSFIQRDPDEGKQPTERTEVMLVYDDEGLYIGARLLDEHPDSIVGLLTRRDAFTTSDRFMVFIDSYHDRRTGFYFGVNAAGTLYDGTLMNDDWDDNTWDGVWEARAQRTPEGWTAEMRIPYSQLRFQRAERCIFGVNFKREIARRNETDYLVFTPRNGSGFVSRFPELDGIEAISPPRRMELLPYVTSRADFSQHEPGNPFSDGSDMSGNVGLDAKLGIGSNLTLDATVNPDFGQVEVDPAVVNLSDQETFYPEKRPFFVEGSSIFDFGQGGSNNFWGFNWGNPSFFYSRRIGRPPEGEVPTSDFSDVPSNTTILGAGKVTGRLPGGWSLGVLSAITDKEEAKLDTAGHHWSSSVEPLTYYGVFRGMKEFHQARQGLGFETTVTARHFDESTLPDQLNRNAAGFGVDGWTFLDHDRAWVLTGWGGATRVNGTAARITDLQESSIHYYQRPDADYKSVDSTATSLSGYAGRVALNRQRGKWQLNAALGLISPGYDVNDLGFQFQSDVINYHTVVTRRWASPGKLFRNLNLNLSAFESRNFAGDATWHGIWNNANGTFLNYWQFSYSVAYNPQAWDVRLTRGGPTAIQPAGWEGNVNVNSDTRKAISFGGFFHASQYSRDADHSWSAGVSATWRPVSSLSLSLEPSYELHRTNAQYVDTFDDLTATTTFGHRYVFADLDQRTVSANIRLNWTFTPRLSLEFYGQPLFSSGDYTKFKEFAKARTYDFNEYGKGGSTITPTTDASGTVTSYTVDPDGAGPATTFSFDNPDFGLASLRGNAVLRWEFLPGSTLYLVWTQNRSGSDLDPTYGASRAMTRLGDAPPENIFAVKVSYWWNP